MRKILIYGFKPYRKYKKNISEEIVKKLKIKGGFRIKKVILPIEFKKDFILKEILKYKPDFIIGLGQKEKGRELEIERKAKNVYREKKKGNKKIINPRGPKEYFLNLKLKRRPKGTKLDYYSHDYLCNFSRYIIMDSIKKEKLKTKFIFIHVPKNFNIQKGIKILTTIITQIVKNAKRSTL